MSESRWVPGLRFGPEFDPEQYELLEFHHRGGEAEVWRAVRTGHNGRKELVAAKIMLERDPSEVRRWLGRWDDVSHNAHRLGVTDLVVPSFLLGPSPHRPGTAPTGGLLGYQISPWVDGVPLHTWARTNRGGPAAAAEVLARLCRIVDELHRKRWVHRDISPANVLVDGDGQVKLIDLTFLTPLDLTLTVAVFTPGHVPPEAEQVGGFPTTAKDLFAVGTLARNLLLPEHGRLDHRLAAEQARAEMLAAGYGEELAQWACEPLARDPDRRPAPLGPWAARGRELLRSHRPLPRTMGLAVLPDAAGRPLVAAAGPSGGVLLAGPGGAGLRAPAGQGPGAVRELVCGRAGRDGELVLCAEDGTGTLWVGTAAGWWEAARGVTGLAGAVDSAGELTVWTAAGGALHSYRWAPGRTLTGRELPGCPADRVLAAVEERPGGWLVLVEHRDRVLSWRPGSGSSSTPLGPPGPLRSGALARSSAGPQAATLRVDGSVQLHTLGTAGAPAEIGDGEPSLGVAMAGHRGGPTIALAGEGGVRLRLPAAGASRRPRWWRPTLRPSSRVALAVGDDWRLCLAAVVEGELQCWQEDAAYRWQSVTLPDAT
ncbi:protein kinase domain-containing protein [Kitasatospora aureofaciens]|uniref:serine/threonine protein kinase n=1 Tax=Kitasatospora aureofaciens TaxID=1894 RepID=UPI001C488517|nr:phosphotransferase [Kitasatospora aureofaciens]MBV6695877.1 phosphotransferase [Kitasatospora aureofaciens]